MRLEAACEGTALERGGKIDGVATVRFHPYPSLAEIGKLTARDLDRDSFVRAMLAEILRMGFDRARFWEIACDMPAGRDIVVLTDQVPDEGSALHAGFDRPLEESAVSADPSGLDPVVVDAPQGRALDPFEKLLDMSGRARVAVRITAGTRTQSILACDWKGRATDLDDETRAALRLAGSQIGAYLALAPSSARLPSTTGDTRSEPKQPTQIVLDAVAAIAAEIDAATTAVFEFDWPTQTLTKIHTTVATQLRERFEHLGDFKERYLAGGPPLTGAAWVDEDLRHIVSTDSVRECREILLDQASVDWHSELLGSISTVLYAVVGSLEKRFLVRFINRVDRPELPFLREASIVVTMVRDLRAKVDAAIALQRLSNLQRVSALAAANAQPDEVLETIGSSLDEEGVRDFVVLCHQEDSSQLIFQRGYGPSAASLKFATPRRWKDDSLYTAAIGQGLGAISLRKHMSSARSQLGAQLATRGYTAVLAQPVEAGFTKGVLFVPLTVGTEAGDTGGLPDNLGYGTTSLIHAYSRLLANAVETQVSRHRVVGARRAYGLLGHEVRRPAGAMGSAGRSAIYASLEALGQLPPGPDRDRVEATIDEHHQQLNRAERRLGAALRLAKLVSRESEGRLRLSFDKADVGEILKSAIDDAMTLARDEQYDWPPFFTLRDSARDLGDLVCDENYLREVFKNVLANAVKYSLPRNPPRPARRDTVIVQIIGEPQAEFVGVRIRNWGWSVPEDMGDDIFEPWVRGYVEEDAAVAGMGLGLFLARRLLAAHDGEISCRSTRTDDLFYPRMTREQRDQGLGPLDRRERVPIYQTDFEIRVPRNLKAGVRTHQWTSASDIYGQAD